MSRPVRVEPGTADSREVLVNNAQHYRMFLHFALFCLYAHSHSHLGTPARSQAGVTTPRQLHCSLCTTIHACYELFCFADVMLAVVIRHLAGESVETVQRQEGERPEQSI